MAGLGVSLATGSGGCSLLIDAGDTQCQVDADCEGLGEAFTDAVCQKNLCVTPVVQDPLVCDEVVPTDRPTVTYTFAPILVNASSAPPFTVKACNRIDPTCVSPVAGPTQVTAGEAVAFEVPTGFTGFFEVQNEGVTLPGMLFLSRPVDVDTIGWSIPVPDQATVAVLALATKQEVDPEAGTMIVIARDCQGEPLEGVTFDNSAGGLSFYIIDTFPDPNLTVTTDEGSAGFVNAEVGTTVLRASHDSGTDLSPVQALLRPGWISYVEVFP